MKVIWKEQRTNEDIRCMVHDIHCMVHEEISLMSTIRNGQKNLLGHVLGGNSLMKTAYEGRVVGKKTVGRSRVELNAIVNRFYRML